MTICFYLLDRFTLPQFCDLWDWRMSKKGRYVHTQFVYCQFMVFQVYLDVEDYVSWWLGQMIQDLFHISCSSKDGCQRPEFKIINIMIQMTFKKLGYMTSQEYGVGHQLWKKNSHKNFNVTWQFLWKFPSEYPDLGVREVFFLKPE